MSKPTKLSNRFTKIIIGLIAISLVIIGKSIHIMAIQGERWNERISTLVKENVSIPALRGNIFAHDGKLMASSIPLYKVSIDFKAPGIEADTLKKHIKPLSIKLHQHFGERSAEAWEKFILDGYRARKRPFRLISRPISYTEMKDLLTFPFLSKHKYKCGLLLDQIAQREKPFNSLASRTIGDVYRDLEMGGKNGLEKAFNEELKGTPGIGYRDKIAGRYRLIEQQAPQNGVDITTTIDIDIQDITETALHDQMIKLAATSGCAVVMEVETGKIKAITNLGRQSNGTYIEDKNYAFADISEPGSTFKVASMMVALENDLITKDSIVHTGNGLYRYAGETIRDHNWHRGGLGTITAEESLWQSSNIGIAKIILKHYENKPGEFVEAIYRLGINREFDIPIPGAGKPIIRHPNDTTRQWYSTTLPWMSFGYETQIPPIYILNFFNAIANGGEMMTPYLVEKITKDGQILEEFEPQTLQSSISSWSTIRTIQEMLVGVVEKGTARNIRSTELQLAGKTGTAQISKGKQGYTSGGKSHLVSFCGYFPADDPKYSCIVSIREPRHGIISAGAMAGTVFKHIAERTYAKSITQENILQDTTKLFLPRVKAGNLSLTQKALDELDLGFEEEIVDSKTWIRTQTTQEKVILKDLKQIQNLTPSVFGMGAMDAVYLLESLHLRVDIRGSGTVYKQSKAPGTRYHKGDYIIIYLK